MALFLISKEPDPALVAAKLKAESDWCTQAKIPHTPTLFFGPYRLPDIYEVEDLPELQR